MQYTCRNNGEIWNINGLIIRVDNEKRSTFTEGQQFTNIKPCTSIGIVNTKITRNVFFGSSDGLLIGQY